MIVRKHLVANRPTRQLVILAALAACSTGAALAEDRVEFNRDVRPILSDTCFPCHGPDKAKRKAELRLDQEEDARADRGGYRAVVAGSVEQSELFRRVSSDDETERMPPPDSGLSLSPQQVETLRRWIAQGAAWQKHWSLVAPVRPASPRVKTPEWARNAIDLYVLAQLEREGLVPSPEAGRTTLIRRLSLDLTGLPPTPAEVDAFLADHSPDAYERVVDRLLASPRYGERMASRWLDAARYADSNGYQTDGERVMWRWRDWVIGAFNNNMPFDQFTIEQLAGDLIPGATLSQRIATGFNRNHRGNAEGGIIPEEYAVEYVVDRVDTTSTVWLGMTMLCARCHDHKYDPIRQREFYALYAFFNNVPERGKALKYGNSPPYIRSPTPREQALLDDLDRELDAAKGRVAQMEPALADAQRAWESALSPRETLRWSITRGLLAHFAFDGSLDAKAGAKGPARLVSGAPSFVAGRDGEALCLDGKSYVYAGDIGNFGFYNKFSITAWVRPDAASAGSVLSRMTDGDRDRADGYSLVLEDGRLHVNLVKRWLDDAIRVRTRRALTPGRWQNIVVTYDGSRVAEGIKVYFDGDVQPLEVLVDDLNQSFQTKEHFRIGAGSREAGTFRGSIDDVRVFDRVLDGEEAAVVASSAPIEAIAAIPATMRTAGQSQKIRTYYIEAVADTEVRAAHRRIVELGEKRMKLVETFPTTMVMVEMNPPRRTFVLKRGEYDKPGEAVDPDVPACLPPLKPEVRHDRLALARWLVQPEHPLTARVAVNRAWQMYVGTGLVKTVDDFGAQGERPRYAELLDWLATEFTRTGWDVKRLQKTIVTSATYRQSSRVAPALLQRDPENRLLARGPRVRLSAEMIRDQALAISGLLVETVGGPSVRPYQPEGLWKDIAEEDYRPDHGASLYRRSLYTFWKRTVSPPEMAAFDASARETCTVRETRTNTPLQALTLLNDVTFVEAARVLAERIIAEGGPAPDDRLALAFRLATARRPTDRELAVLRNDFESHLVRFRHDPHAAAKLITTGEFRQNPTLDAVELAAYTATANLVLNLDEAITKE